MVIHFPTALLPADLVLSFLHYYKNDPVFGQAAFFCLVGGVAIGILAALTGLLDLILIPRENKQALATGLLHGFLNGTIIIIFGIYAYKEWSSYPAISVPTTITLLVKAILIVALFAGNYIGGKLIYKHKVGIENN